MNPVGHPRGTHPNRRVRQNTTSPQLLGKCGPRAKHFPGFMNQRNSCDWVSFVRCRKPLGAHRKPASSKTHHRSSTAIRVFELLVSALPGHGLPGLQIHLVLQPHRANGSLRDQLPLCRWLELEPHRRRLRAQKSDPLEGRLGSAAKMVTELIPRQGGISVDVQLIPGLLGLPELPLVLESGLGFSDSAGRQVKNTPHSRVLL
mmetsp:Transcript_20194/g.51346  ORF Transcript_20194/g.51346 Transcript_20194/m.51346 type:complete len:203 (-) Transcript_20194:201-809(-)